MLQGKLLTLGLVVSACGRGPEEGGLTAIRTIFRRLLADKGGATAIEYGLIAALIAVASIGGMNALGGNSGAMWGDIRDDVDAAM